ncbi:MAG: lipid-A-disaccharide synthase [Cyanobacteriota bacterium]|nr:lipid-A-disaccharide synthase [Cyanobacteriota bacterium]
MVASEAKVPRLLLVAGEASGDLHGGHLLEALRHRCPSAHVVGVGGEHLRRAGMEILADVKQLSAVGAVEIAGSIPRHWRVMRLLKRQMDQHRPAVVVLIDYPGFNMIVAREAHRRGIPVFFYIAPQVWAWRQGRARRMAAFIDRLAVIFPFEPAFFNAYGRPFAHYVGHPLLDGLRVSADRATTRARHGFSDTQPLLVLMPGSRRSEVRLLLPDLLDAAQRLKTDGWQVVLLQAPTLGEAELSRLAGRPLGVPVVRDDTYNLLAAADAGLITSGTATLEAALLGCPPVIVYRLSWLSFQLARLLIGRRLIGLPNVVLNRLVFPELIQHDVSAGSLVRAVQALQADRARIAADLQELRSTMGSAGASERAAELLLELVP